MNLLVDIGNSYIKCGIIKKEKITNFRIFKYTDKTSFAYFKKYKFDNIIFSSVVGSINSYVIKELNKIPHRQIINIDDLKKNIKIKPIIKQKNKIIGSDLLADLIATRDLYNGPAIIVDIGTVCKVIALDKTNTFIGCAFYSGLSMAMRALSSDTYALPKIKLTTPKSPIGVETSECIKSGLYYSTLYSIEGFVREYRKVLGKNTKVILTGGSAVFFKEQLPDFIYNPLLTLYGIYFIFKENENEL